MHGWITIVYPVSHGEMDKSLNSKRMRNMVYNTEYPIKGKSKMMAWCFCTKKGHEPA